MSTPKNRLRIALLLPPAIFKHPFPNPGSAMRPHLVRTIAAAAVSLTCAAPLAAQQTGASHPLDRANLDTTCAPCTDFYTFANGGWIAKTSIPAAYSSWGSFNELQDHNTNVVHQILDDEAAAVGTGKPSPGPTNGRSARSTTPAWTRRRSKR